MRTSRFKFIYILHTHICTHTYKYIYIYVYTHIVYILIKQSLVVEYELYHLMAGNLPYFNLDPDFWLQIAFRI